MSKLKGWGRGGGICVKMCFWKMGGFLWGAGAFSPKTVSKFIKFTMSWSIKPNPEDRINRKLNDQINDRKNRKPEDPKKPYD